MHGNAVSPGFLDDTELIHALAGALDTGVCLFDRELRFRFITPLAASLNGMTVEQHLGRTLGELLPDIASALTPSLMSILQGGNPLINLEFSAEIPASPGDSRCWLGTYRPLHRDGQIIGLICTFRDITAQRNAEQAIRASEQRVRRVLDSLFAFVGVLLPDGTLIEANRAPLEAAGIHFEDVAGQKFWDCFWWNFDPDVQTRIRSAVEDACLGKVSRFDIEARMAGDSRMILDFMMAPMRDEQGDITLLIPSAIDISRRKEGEEALKLSEQRFRQVVESVPEGLLVVNQEGQIELVNHRMESLFGYSRDELIGQPLTLLIPEQHRTQHHSYFSGYMTAPHNREMSQRSDIEGQRKDGSRFPVEVGLNALNTEEGTMALATVADMTRRRADQAIIERALEEKTILLNEVHHRVKNNLQVVSSLLRLQSEIAPPDVRALLEQSQNRVRAMALIHQLLYERSNFAELDFGDYCQQLCRLLIDSIAPDQHIAIMTHSGEEPVLLSLSRAVPCGLLINELVTNAVKHAYPDGRSGTISVTVIRADDAIRITIDDDGIGLPEGLLPGQGETLGFQLLPLLAEQARGRLQVESGHGAHFTLTLPLR